jgi:hypothetical protein
MSKVNPSRQEMIEMYKALDEDQFQFAVEYMGPLPNERTFSTDALDKVLEQMQMFIGARVLRRWKDTQQPPQRMTLTLTLNWDDDAEGGLA